MRQIQNKNPHLPVLLQAVTEVLAPKRGESYLDLTAGYGGHAAAILAFTKAPERAVLVDRDSNAIRYLEKEFAGLGVSLQRQDFAAASSELADQGRQFDLIMADLGVSSPHLNEANRGFSAQHDGPLDMRMDTGQGLTAEQIVNDYSEDDLAKLLRDYGEEPKAKKIARLIAEHRPIKSTAELAAIASKAWPGHSRVHPATRTFQAVRIAVNDELAQLERSLPYWQRLLAPGGRLAIISFHSLEDRIVKRYLAEQAGDRYDAPLRLITKHPVRAGPEEIAINPRARSAKLRAAAKIKIK